MSRSFLFSLFVVFVPMNVLNSSHPAVALAYFLSVLGIGMFSSHPLVALTAALGGAAFLLHLRRFGRAGQGIKTCAGLLAVVLVFGLTNPIFSHHGETALFFLNGNPVTLEAVYYGLCLGCTAAAALAWFGCVNEVLTEEKTLFLFGRAAPKLALLISCALRYIPRLRAQAQKIRRAQTATGVLASESWPDRIRGTLRVWSALVSWSLESAMETGNSMRARGYGLPGRTYYSTYRFTARDGCVLALILALDACTVVPLAMGALRFAFYPTPQGLLLSPGGVLAVVAFALLCLLPTASGITKELQWNYYRSRT